MNIIFNCWSILFVYWKCYSNWRVKSRSNFYALGYSHFLWNLTLLCIYISTRSWTWWSFPLSLIEHPLCDMITCDFLFVVFTFLRCSVFAWTSLKYSSLKIIAATLFSSNFHLNISFGFLQIILPVKFWLLPHFSIWLLFTNWFLSSIKLIALYYFLPVFVIYAFCVLVWCATKCLI